MNARAGMWASVNSNAKFQNIYVSTNFPRKVYEFGNWKYTLQIQLQILLQMGLVCETKGTICF